MSRSSVEQLPTVHSRRAQPSRGRVLREGFLVVAVIAVTFAVWTWAAIGPLEHFDVLLNHRRHIQDWKPLLHVLDRIGQRAVCLPVLVLVTGYVAWRTRRWRPVTVAVSSVVAVNLAVLVLKLWLGRGQPRLEDPDFFNGGDLYPSGHTANVVLVYGLAVFLIVRYLGVSRRTRRVLCTAVLVLSVVMTVTSLTLRWHWFTDLIGGLFVGAAVLQATSTLDSAVPLPPTPPSRVARQRRISRGWPALGVPRQRSR
jgi:membrane-associated phospholipid phosphatase